MLPQTIYFQKEENKKRTSYIYNGMKNMLFLARDRVSYGMAKEMFPDIPVRQFPDIVTTLIGNYSFNNERDGVLLCCRDDGEKFYSDEELQGLINKLEKTSRVYKTDTTKTGKKDDIVENAEKYILEEIESYSHYKVIITDRYHGTIFSLVAGTPVVIIKTTDHKVITGAEWFKGVYDSHVFVAENLEDAYEIAKKVIETGSSHTLQPYFEKEYYDKLPEIFEKEIKE
jgi:exopolysaccharide biosynthesis predicted pyruvyltransferase EpsI